MRVGAIPENDAEQDLLSKGQVATPFFDTHFASLLARTVQVGTKLGVFDALEKQELGAEEVARRVGTEPEATRKLLNALVGAGYLHLGDGRFSLSPVARRWLLASAESSIRDYVLELELCEWKWIEHYEKFLREGVPIRIHEAMSEEQWKAYQNGMRALASFSAPELTRRTPMPAAPRDMLDVGGSHGYFSVAFCRAYPTLRATVLDLPNAVKQAAPILARERMGGRVVHRAGDAITDDFGEATYDLVFLSHVAHHFDEATNRSIARRAAKALRPAGYYVIQEGVRPESPLDAGQPALLLDLFCALTSEAGTWSFEQMADWQRSAGLVPQEPIWLTTAPGIGLQAAQKVT